MSGYLADLSTAVAQLAIDGGVAGGYWTAGMKVEPGGKPAVAALKMPDAPDRVIVVTPTPLTDVLTFDDDDTQSSVGMQLRIRGRAGSTSDARDTADALYGVLHGRTGIPAGAQRIALITQSSSTSVGEDSSSRWSWVANYYLVVDRS